MINWSFSIGVCMGSIFTVMALSSMHARKLNKLRRDCWELGEKHEALKVSMNKLSECLHKQAIQSIKNNTKDK